MPRISVLLPVRDAAPTLVACLRSIQRQAERDWECVLVDDGSSDDSLAVAHGFASEDPRFRVIPAAREGLVPALNLGVDRCRGRFVARMDADDLMHSRRLAEQAALLEAEPRWAGVGCHVRIAPRRGIGRGLRDYESWINSIRSPREIERELLVECPLAHPTWMLRREIFDEDGYVDRGWPEDYDLLLRSILIHGRQWGVLASRRHVWCDRPGRLSRSSGVYSAARFTACKAHYLARTFLGGSDRYILWGYGSTGRALRRALLTHGRRPSHIVEVHPGRLGHRIHGAEVVPAEALPRLPRHPLVVSVAREGPRGKVRAFLVSTGWVEGRDFVCAA